MLLINVLNFFLGKDMVLSWEQRVKILRDCALALRYLHSYIDGFIVHRDIKVSATKSFLLNCISYDNIYIYFLFL